MSIARQLYQLQEIDLELESSEQALKQVTSQLGESEAVIGLRRQLTGEHQHRDELSRQQRSREWEIDDLTNKLSTIEGELYSGRIQSPKELTNLQQEIDSLKKRRRQLEDRTLEIMDQVELASGRAATTENELGTREAEWQNQQQQLAAEMEQLKTTLANLKNKRQSLVGGIDAASLEIYQEIKRQKGTAVAKVEQGMCRGCRISLPVSELQLTRSNHLVRCSSCGRVLFSV